MYIYIHIYIYTHDVVYYTKVCISARDLSPVGPVEASSASNIRWALSKRHCWGHPTPKITIW